MGTTYSGQRIVIVGLARSGVGAANLLAYLGAGVTVTDLKKPDQLTPFIKALDPAISLSLGRHPVELFESADTIVVSPGIPLDIEPLKLAQRNGIKIIGELELACHVITQVLKVDAPEFLAITGTNGKSTTTALLDTILRSGGISTIIGGNIGNSLAAEVHDILINPPAAPIKYVVAELSSFQLETIGNFRPKGSAILNITPDHLDRYHEMELYVRAKCRVSMNQKPGDYLVLNADDPFSAEIEQIIGKQDQKPQVFYFSRKKVVEGICFLNGKISFNLSADKLGAISRDLAVPSSSFDLDPSSFVIKGVHNIENAMAAALMAYLAGCNLEGIRNALATFQGLEHRLELVRELEGVKYINDSKGTNVGAVMKSLEGFAEPVILIAGGRDKDSDFTLLRPLIKEKVKNLILVGEAAEKIRKAVCDVTPCEMAGFDFRAAIAKASEAATQGDVVLLSPACASFDMFMDFEDRGRQFKQMVMEL